MSHLVEVWYDQDINIDSENDSDEISDFYKTGVILASGDGDDIHKPDMGFMFIKRVGEYPYKIRLKREYGVYIRSKKSKKSKK
jgi:hypothetical protein